MGSVECKHCSAKAKELGEVLERNEVGTVVDSYSLSFSPKRTPVADPNDVLPAVPVFAPTATPPAGLSVVSGALSLASPSTLAGPPVVAEAAPRESPSAGAGARSDTSFLPVEKKRDNRAEILQDVPVIQRCLQSHIPALANAMEEVTFKKGTTIGRQGHSAEEFFVIKAGSVISWFTEDGGEPQQVATLQRSDLFDEAAMAPHGRFSNTFVADTDVECLSMSAEVFQEMGLTSKVLTGKRKVVGRGALQRSCTQSTACESPSKKSTRSSVHLQEETKKTPEEQQFLQEALRNNTNLSPLLPSSTNFMEEIVNIAWKENVNSGDALIVEGDTAAECFYIIESGMFGVYITDTKKQSRRMSTGCLPAVAQPSRLSCPASRSKDAGQFRSTPVIKTGGMKDTSSVRFRSSPGIQMEGFKETTPTNRRATCTVVHEMSSLAPEEDDEEEAPPSRLLKKIERGASFGELALLYYSPRTATVRALEDSVVWVIDRKTFKELLIQVAAENEREYVAYLDGMDVLSALSAEEKLTVAKAIERLHFIKDQVIFKCDDMSDRFYILLDGTVQIDREGKLPRTVHADSNKVRYFGDRALLEDQRFNATVTVRSETACALTLDRGDFNALLGPLRHIIEQRTKEEAAEVEAVYVDYLNQLELVTSLSQSQKASIAKSLKWRKYDLGDVVFKRGAKPESFYILLDGTLDVVGDSKRKVIEACSAERNIKYFGDKAILKKAVRDVTVKVSSQIAIVLVLDVESFNKMLAPLKDVFFKLDTVRRQDFRPLSRELKDMTTLALLGCGSLGPVELVKHKSTCEVYAMKSLNKGLIVSNDMQAAVLGERKCWLLGESPFVIKLHALYNEKQTLSYLMDYLPGGALSDAYNRNRFYGKVEHARFYVSGMVYALKHLHKRRIIHRGLRIENILLDAYGYPQLIDFGLAKCVIGKTYTTCGIPESMAPEVLVGTGHTRAVDWWALGILAFELMSGSSPFASSSPMDVYSKVMRGIATVQFPQACKGALADFLCSLLDSEPQKRLGMQGSVDNIMTHPWYESFDWVSMLDMTKEPPFKPQLKNSEDHSHYIAYKKDLPKIVKYIDDGSGWDKDFAVENCSQQRSWD